MLSSVNSRFNVRDDRLITHHFAADELLEARTHQHVDCNLLQGKAWDIRSRLKLDNSTTRQATQQIKIWPRRFRADFSPELFKLGTFRIGSRAFASSIDWRTTTMIVSFNRSSMVYFVICPLPLEPHIAVRLAVAIVQNLHMTSAG